MHHSRLAGFIIDCKTEDLDGAARFWSATLGLANKGDDGHGYAPLDGSAHQLNIEVQKVEHESRVHLDLETDDLDAEAARLEKLGATKVKRLERWWIMEAPTGQRFCVVKAKRELRGLPGVTAWE
jgi:predicted enzyme related to lactoylglutathione lyase